MRVHTPHHQSATREQRDVPPAMYFFSMFIVLIYYVVEGRREQCPALFLFEEAYMSGRLHTAAALTSSVQCNKTTKKSVRRRETVY